jgi:tyrosyl-tRNA synthetase
MDAKMRLAEEIVSGFQGPDPARKAAENFQRVFRDRQAPKETTEITVAWDSKAGAVWREDVLRGDIRELGQFTTLNVPELGIEKWSKFLVLLKRVASVAEAERLIKQNALEIEGEILADPLARINLTEKRNSLIRLGKKQFFRLIVQ